jgi:putative SOS response-associated peptidase YedK
MCGRYAYYLPPEAMVALFKTLSDMIYPDRFNIAPTQPIIAIWEESGTRKANLARWGFVPAWAKEPQKFPLIINARVEGLIEKPAFRDAIKHTRCIVPASGYYEWRVGPDKVKRPYFVALADGSPMAFAGLYSTWVGPDGEEVDTAAIVTVAAKGEMAELHERIPAILSGDAVEQWLDVRHIGVRGAHQLALPLEDGAATYHPVSTRVNSANNDGPDLIMRVTETLAEPMPKAKRKAASGQLDLF